MENFLPLSKGVYTSGRIAEYLREIGPEITRLQLKSVVSSGVNFLLRVPGVRGRVPDQEAAGGHRESPSNTTKY